MSLLTPHKYGCAGLWLLALGFGVSGALAPQTAQASEVVKLARLVLTGKTGGESAGASSASAKAGAAAASAAGAERLTGVVLDALQARTTANSAVRSAG
ncbi:MAG: hypothetical protein JOY60_13995 [Burkholderiaceae bacterium]|nr:hypothetical protein [Burkholderiaceae bacterium]